MGCVLFQYVVTPRRQSTAIALQILVSHLLGDAGSPYLIGIVSEFFFLRVKLVETERHRIVGTSCSKTRNYSNWCLDTRKQKDIFLNIFTCMQLLVLWYCRYVEYNPIPVAVSSSVQCVEIYFYFKFANSCIFEGVRFCKDSVMDIVLGFKHFLLSSWGVSWKLIKYHFMPWDLKLLV